MANRTIFILLFIVIFSVSIEAKNILKSISLESGKVALHFKKEIRGKDFRATAAKSKAVTKYVFDFKNCYLGGGAKSLYNLKGSLKSIRVAQYKKDTVRVVIDSKKSYNVKYYQKNSPTFYITVPKGVSLIKKSSNKKSRESVKKSNLKSSPKELFNYVNGDEGSSSASSEKYSVNLKHNYTIMVDAGHGGKDSGTCWGSEKEKKIVLAIAKRVYRKLRTLGFKVKMTRTRDHYITLNGRIKRANRDNADLFISIHANAVSDKSRVNVARGVETYFLQNTRNARAKRVAAKENAAMLKSMDSTTKAVLINTVFTGPKIQLSHRLGLDVQKEILKSLRARYKGVKDGGVRGAPFYVLVGAEMPAILVEVGYLSNPKERDMLRSAKYQNRLAEGIVRGVINYLKNREREME